MDGHLSLKKYGEVFNQYFTESERGSPPDNCLQGHFYSEVCSLITFPSLPGGNDCVSAVGEDQLSPEPWS